MSVGTIAGVETVLVPLRVLDVFVFTFPPTLHWEMVEHSLEDNHSIETPFSHVKTPGQECF